MVSTEIRSSSGYAGPFNFEGYGAWPDPWICNRAAHYQLPAKAAYKQHASRTVYTDSCVAEMITPRSLALNPAMKESWAASSSRAG